MFNLDWLVPSLKSQTGTSAMFPGLDTLSMAQPVGPNLDVNTILNPDNGGGFMSKLSALLSGPHGNSLISMLGATGAALAPEGSWQEKLGSSAGGMARGQMIAEALGQKGAGNNFLNQLLLGGIK